MDTFSSIFQIIAHHRICIAWMFLIIDHNFHSMTIVFMDNIFHTYFVYDPYLVKDYGMFIIRLILLLLHDDDGSKTGWNVNRLSVRGGNIYRGTLIGTCSSSSSCTLIHYFSFIFLLRLWSIIVYHFPDRFSGYKFFKQQKCVICNIFLAN